MGVRKGLLAAVVVILGTAGAARAQVPVPGGWSPQFGYQTLGGVAVAPGAVAYGGGYPGYGTGYVGYPYPTYGPSYPITSGFSGYLPPPRTVNQLGFLGSTIGRTTRARRGR